MTLEEIGAYHVLLDHQWLHGDIPSEPNEIAVILGRNTSLKKAKLFLNGTRLARRFSTKKSGRLYSKKLERIRREKQRYSKEQSDKALKAWELRKKNR